MATKSFNAQQGKLHSTVKEIFGEYNPTVGIHNESYIRINLFPQNVVESIFHNVSFFTKPSGAVAVDFVFDFNYASEDHLAFAAKIIGAEASSNEKGIITIQKISTCEKIINFVKKVKDNFDEIDEHFGFIRPEATAEEVVEVPPSRREIPGYHPEESKKKKKSKSHAAKEEKDEEQTETQPEPAKPKQKPQPAPVPEQAPIEQLQSTLQQFMQLVEKNEKLLEEKKAALKAAQSKVQELTDEIATMETVVSQVRKIVYPTKTD